MALIAETPLRRGIRQKENAMLTKKVVQSAYEKAGIKLEKIRRARLNDGWFVYHPFCHPTKCKTYKEVGRIASQVTKEVTTKNIYQQFIDDSDLETLYHNINEARVYAELPRLTNQQFQELLRA